MEKVIRPFTVPNEYEIMLVTSVAVEGNTILEWTAETSVDTYLSDSKSDSVTNDSEYTASPSYSSSFQEIVYEERAFVITSSPVDEAEVWEEKIVLRTTYTYDVGAAMFNMDSGEIKTEADLPWPHKLVMTKEENFIEGYTKTWFNTEWYSWRDNMGRRANSKQSGNTDRGESAWL